MAKSYVCTKCNTFLKSVKELQDHAEVTGHSSFDESSVAIKTMVCTECGKPCRSDAERDLHTRHTGHSNYEDKTNEAGILNTERDMKEARTELLDMDGPTSAASTSAAREPGQDVEMVPAVVDESMLKEMEGMGFSAPRATRALHFSGNSSVEGAINWLDQHEADIDLDEPLLIPKESLKPKLSPEEARKKAEEAIRKAKEKREREEKEQERVRELERIRAGKEMLAMKAKADEADRKRAIEERQREKQEEQRAREKIKAKLEEDRRERRRQMGLPEELTEEEKRAEAEKVEKQRKEEEGKKVFTFVKPISVIDKVRKTLVDMKKASSASSAEEERFKTAVSTMLKYVGNVASQPDEEKFRNIKLSNAAFQQRVASLEGSLVVLEQAGFQRVDELLTMPREKVNVEVLNSVGGELNNALTNPFFGAL
ncbi:hypothetical protein CEUSTIGMA_g9190.t1 [Chlamydomonas eustigma]|uniref:UBA domain-containing protein n=1 Tax=Chlamydomonas eustigma TaxID=1157962 RepID=A0A250XFS3_9CHLO|nr:hypothetical protein CEUSTIGMA_g9190.t1 [Chlamydomonas eustigma]|eukprot:GAX81762.1 hypothetical protein CEUSTIGMA_g9190.t1 [Chlamydomonas eustigma]